MLSKVATATHVAPVSYPTASASHRPFEIPEVPSSLDQRALFEDHNESRLVEAVQSFEAFFIQYLLKTMRQTTLKSGLLGGGFAADTYEEMLDQALAESIAEAGGIGVTDVMMADMRQSGWIA